VDVSLTSDTLFGGSLVCRQYRVGYRFSIDAVLAAHFCRPAARDCVLDLGCGCGIISLIMAYRHPDIRVTGIEIQPDLVQLARDNIGANELQPRLTVLEGDFCEISKLVQPESFDIVVSNPPYRQQGRGRVNPDDQKARARHEIDAGLPDLVRAAAFGLKNRGRVVLIYPAARLVPLMTELKKNSLELKKIQPVYSYPGCQDARLVLIEAVKNGGEEVRILPPFFIYSEKNGPYTDSMQKYYTP
jgi:tRNA1(Val) A37 N6-methylase TrmN6